MSICRYVSCAVAVVGVGCTQTAPEVFTFAVATFSHETCTFCPGGDTDIERWTRGRAPYEGDEVLAAGPYIRGFVAAAGDHPDVRLVGLESPAGVYGGSSASWNTEAAFNHFLDRMLLDLQEAMPVDGVYLALHGAMAVRNVPRPEAEIARRFRETVGPGVPIVGTFDLHGNEDAEFLRWADMSFVTKRYPHYDAYLQGERAARAMVKIVRGRYDPSTTTAKPGIITPTVVQWTGQSPSMDIMERARRWEARHPGVYVSVFYGFPWSDVPDVGATVQVMTNGDQALADEIAADMTDFFWRVRERFVGGEYPRPPAAIRSVRDALARGSTPIVVGDYSDRSGDATHLLKELLDQDVGRTLYGTLRDERVISTLVEQGTTAGDLFSMDVGGFAGPASGSPVRINGVVRYLGSGLGFDRIAIIDYRIGNTLVITPALVQITEPASLAIGSIRIDEYDVFVVKSRVHFRRGFDETGFARTIIVADAPGPYIGTIHLDALPYENVDLTQLYPYGIPMDRR